MGVNVLGDQSKAGRKTHEFVLMLFHSIEHGILADTGTDRPRKSWTHVGKHKNKSCNVPKPCVHAGKQSGEDDVETLLVRRRKAHDGGNLTIQWNCSWRLHLVRNSWTNGSVFVGIVLLTCSGVKETGSDGSVVLYQSVFPKHGFRQVPPYVNVCDAMWPDDDFWNKFLWIGVLTEWWSRVSKLMSIMYTAVLPLCVTSAPLLVPSTVVSPDFRTPRRQCCDELRFSVSHVSSLSFFSCVFRLGRGVG